MRFTRVERIKIYKNEKIKKAIVYGIILPCFSILAGYLITLLFILPAIAH